MSLMDCIQQLESYGCTLHDKHKVALIVECMDTKMFGSVLDYWMKSDHVATFEEIHNSVKTWYVNAKRNEDISDHVLRGQHTDVVKARAVSVQPHNNKRQRTGKSRDSDRVAGAPP